MLVLDPATLGANPVVVVLRHSADMDFENQGSGVPNYLGPVVISPDGSLGLGAVEEGQHHARYAAQRRQPQFPEHGPGDQLPHRSCDQYGEFWRPDRPRQREHGERGGVRALWRIHVRCARDEPRGGGHQRARPGASGSASTSGARRRRVAVSADGYRLYVSNFMDRTVGVYDLTRIDRPRSVERTANCDAAIGSNRET